MTKERYQNLVSGDNVNLRLLTYNGNAPKDVRSIAKVDIFYLDPNDRTVENPDGRRLVETFTGNAVVTEDEGQYLLSLQTDPVRYIIGKYIDVWTLLVQEDEPEQTVSQPFEIIPDIWYTSPVPIVYDFKFHFRPNRMRKGSNQFLIIEIVPNVPRATDLEKYYENLAIVSQMYISIEQACGPCLPAECDLRLIVEDEPVQFRERRFAYYKLDTTDMDCGIYNIWFKLEFGGNVYIGDKMQLQIY